MQQCVECSGWFAEVRICPLCKARACTLPTCYYTHFNNHTSEEWRNEIEKAYKASDSVRYETLMRVVPRSALPTSERTTIDGWSLTSPNLTPKDFCAECGHAKGVHLQGRSRFNNSRRCDEYQCPCERFVAVATQTRKYVSPEERDRARIKRILKRDEEKALALNDVRTNADLEVVMAKLIGGTMSIEQAMAAMNIKVTDGPPQTPKRKPKPKPPTKPQGPPVNYRRVNIEDE